MIETSNVDGMFFSKRTSRNDTMITDKHPIENWDSISTIVFIEKSKRSRVTIEAIDKTSEAMWRMSGTGLSFSFTYLGLSERLCDVCGKIVNGRGELFDVLAERFGEPFKEFAKCARRKLPHKFRFYKWPDYMRHEVIKTWT